MRKARSYNQKLYSTTFTFILLISAIVIPLSLLIQPTWSQPPWWNDNWNFRKQIIIDCTRVMANLENFPVLIDIVDPDLKAKAQFEGDDIVFTIDHNSTLNHEMELYDGTSGRLVAWVKIPLLSSVVNTVFYMYYGNPNAQNQQSPSAVWDSNFVMVQHLEDLSGTRFDSTSNGNNATPYGTVNKASVGKIDGADAFNGAGYEWVPQVFLPTSSVTVELWLRPSSYSTTTWTKYINTGPATISGICGGQTSLSQDRWSLTLTWNNNAKSFSTGGQPSGYDWIHLAVTWSGSSCSAYYNGVKIKEGPISGTPDWISKPLYLGSNYAGGERFRGSLDEVRISNVARSAAWIQTSYNNQKDPTTFHTTGYEEPNPNISSPLVYENPKNEAADVYTNPTLSVKVVNPSNRNMTIVFKEKISNIWIDLGFYENVPDGTYSMDATQMKNLGTTYYWGVYVTNGQTWTNKTFSLTTTTKILQQKWITSNIPGGASGVLIADINNDGLEEIIHAGIGGVIALNGTDGSVIWNVSDSYIGNMAQPQMADLNKDSILEIVVPLEGNSLTATPAGLLVLHANTGSTYWRIGGLGLETYSSPVICDIDGDGYPEIFVASTDVYKGLSGTGRINSLSYDGRILHQTFAWRPCGGGLSIADTDGDGEFELYMGDRYMYLNSVEYGDNDYGRGVQSYWAKNLTLRWFRPEIFCSSQIPMIADVNRDGILDIIIGDMNGGVAVLNSTDGSTIRMYKGGLGVTPTHYQPSVHDIDGDGNLEMLMADPHENPRDPVSQWPSDDIVIWDLVSWKADTKMYIGKSFYGPQLADVTGDDVMEIIVCNYRGIFIFDKAGRVLDGITGLSGTLNYAVAQDIDGDGYIEIVVSSQGGSISAYDTPARKPNPRARTEVQFYSEYRRGAAEYVPILTTQKPIIFYTNPSDQSTNVPLQLSQIQFTLTDYQHQAMNYTVKTNPDIGNDSKTNVTNGKYALNITNLTPSTTYTWTINVTDGTNWTNKAFTFTTESLQRWWNSTWQYRKAIKIDRNKVAGNLGNFPVLVDLVDSNLATKAQQDGDDIVFADNNGIKLAHEIELYDYNTGRLVAWVNVPYLSSAEDTVFYMYYGNPIALNQQNASAVWDSSFVMVQHLEELSGTRLDSTSSGNNATPYGTVNKASVGKIDGADSFNSAGYEWVPQSFLPTSAITVELWLKPSSYSTTTWTKYINTGPTTTSGICGGQTSLSADRWSLTLTWDNNAKSFSTGGQPSGYNWIHLAVTWSGSSCSAYYNGVKIKEGPISGTPDWVGKALYLGSNYGGGERFNGAIDEVRISNVARSAAWIQTSYNNQKNTTTFYTIGGEETHPDEPVVFSPSPPNKATDISPSLTQLSFNITDYQNDPMNYTVTTTPNIGSGTGINVSNGRFSIPISGVQYSKTYTWIVSVTDGTHWTNITFTFTTLPTGPPTQSDPILVKSGNNIICYNQSTTDPDGDKVTNTYNWYRNNTSLTNLLLPFNTNSSITVKDYSGYNNNGIIVRGVTWTSNGKIGGAYNFNRGLIEIPGSNTLDGGGQWSEITVEHWIYLTASQSNTRTIARIPSYEIGISGNKLFASVWTATGNPKISGHNQITYNTTLQMNTWYHVILTYKKGVAMTLYLNGAAVATKTPSESTTLNYNIQPSGTINPLYIGWFDYFKGIVDEVRIYPRSLSQQQISQRYLETRDGLSNISTIVAGETLTGETWICEVTPNDSHLDGVTKPSNAITIGSNSNPIAYSLSITPNAPTTNDNLTASYMYFDPEDDPENGTQIQWFKNAAIQLELNDTLIVPYDLTSQGDIWYFTARPRDGTSFGELQTSSSVTIIGNPPFIDSFTPENATLTVSEGDIIEFTHTSSDPDNNTLTYSWLLDWIEQSVEQNWTYTTDYDSAGTHNITLTVSDSEVTISRQWNVTVINVNRAPEASDVAILPDNPSTTDGLTANYTYYDPDGDLENGTEIFWYRNGTLQPNLNNTITVPANQTTKGETWHFTVRPSDGTVFGEEQTSLNFTILNSPPQIETFTPENTTLEINEGETIEFTHTSSDPDNDTISYSWILDGKTQDTTQNWNYTADYNSTGAHNITLAVHDGELNTTQQWAVTVAEVNRPPEALNLTISPSIPFTNDDLVANYTFFDVDGDLENGTEIRWYCYKNGTLQAQFNDTLVIAENQTSKGQVWYFTVRPSDGKKYGEIRVSPNATIQNSAPSITSRVEIVGMPSNLTEYVPETDTLFVRIINWSDPDGDPENYTYQWQIYQGGAWIDIEGANASTLGPQYFSAGDSVAVWVTPYDGEDYGTPSNDPINIEGANASTLGPQYFSAGDSVAVWVTPYDGEDYGTPSNDPILVSNSPP